MPTIGVEPIPSSRADFKSTVSTIPPSGQILHLRMMRIELTLTAWKAVYLPLIYIRI